MFDDALVFALHISNGSFPVEISVKRPDWGRFERPRRAFRTSGLRSKGEGAIQGQWSAKRSSFLVLAGTGHLSNQIRPLGRVLINRDCSAIAGCRKRCVQIALDAQAIFFRRRHQPRRPPPAKMRMGAIADLCKHCHEADRSRSKRAAAR